MTDLGGRTQMRLRQRHRSSHPPSSSGGCPEIGDGCLGIAAVAALGLGLAAYFFSSGSKEEVDKARDALQNGAQMDVLKSDDVAPRKVEAEAPVEK